MITPKLEELIWCGDAAYKTWTVGTGSAQLTVAENKAIIVLAIDYFPFIDADESGFGPAQAADFRARVNQQIILSSKNQRAVFLARSYFETTNGIRPGSHTFNCYLPFTDIINIFIGVIPPPPGWTVTNGAAPLRSRAKETPLGYGTVDTKNVSTILAVELGNLDNSEIRPHEDTPAQRPFSFNSWQTSIDAGTSLNDPNTNNNNVGNLQFPCLTVHYVEINKRLTDTFIN